MKGGITLGDRRFTYQLHFGAPLSKVEVQDEDGNEHIFYFTEVKNSYRDLIINELKRIGWLSDEDD